MDKMTSSLLLNAALNGGNNNHIADLYKELNKDEGGPSKADSNWVISHIGRRMKFNDTYHGIVESLNTASSGLYPGSRYPAWCRMDDGELMHASVSEIILTECE